MGNRQFDLRGIISLERHLHLDEPKFLSAESLERRYDTHRSAFARWAEKRGFPSPRYLGSRRLWILAEVEAWEAKWLSGPTKVSVNVKNLKPKGGLKSLR